MKTLALITALAVVFIACASQEAEEYELVILNGRVMDPETMYDDIANVGDLSPGFVQL